MNSRIQYQIITEPVSTKPETVSVDRWLQPLSQPFFAKFLPVSVAVTTAVGPISTSKETTTVDRWYQQLSVPRTVPFNAAFEQNTFTWNSYTPPPSVGWLSSFSLPVGSKVLQLASGAIAPVAEQPETTSLDRWYQNLSAPLYSKAALRSANQQAFFAPVSEASETTTVDRWLQALSEPARARFSTSLLVPAFTWAVCTPTVAAPTWGWLGPLSEPPRRTSFVDPVFGYQPVIPALPVIPPMAWLMPLSTPLFSLSIILTYDFSEPLLVTTTPATPDRNRIIYGTYQSRLANGQYQTRFAATPSSRK